MFYIVKFSLILILAVNIHACVLDQALLNVIIYSALIVAIIIMPKEKRTVATV